MTCPDCERIGKAWDADYAALQDTSLKYCHAILKLEQKEARLAIVRADLDETNARWNEMRRERDEARAVVAKAYNSLGEYGEVNTEELLHETLKSWDLDPINNPEAFRKAVEGK